MNDSVMGSSNIRYICKTGYMGYCDSSALQALPLNSQYVVVGEGAGASGDIEHLQDEINALSATVDQLSDTVAGISLEGYATESYVNNKVGIEANTRLNRDNELEAMIEAIESSGNSTTMQIHQLYSASTYANTISLVAPLTTFNLVFIITSNSNNDINVKILNTNDIAASSIIVIGTGAASLNYVVNAEQNTLTCSTISSTTYIKNIIGIYYP